jgi:hypothetical protein
MTTFSKLGIQLFAKWQLVKSTQLPSPLARIINF